MKVLSVAGLVMAMTVATHARAAGSAEEGETLVNGTCLRCHTRDISSSTEGSAPSLRSLFDERHFTAEQLRNFLALPHATRMPPIALSRTQVESVIAYFRRQGYPIGL